MRYNGSLERQNKTVIKPKREKKHKKYMQNEEAIKKIFGVNNGAISDRSSRKDFKV